MLTECFVVLCDRRGCRSHFLGWNRAALPHPEGQKYLIERTAADAIAAGWLRFVPLESRENPCRRERWHCPEHRTR